MHSKKKIYILYNEYIVKIFYNITNIEYKYYTHIVAI